MASVSMATPVAASDSKAALTQYVRARAVQIDGDQARAARMLATLAEEHPADPTYSNRAIAAAIESGETELAVRIARRRPLADLTLDARLLLAVDALRSKEETRAEAILGTGVTSTERDLFLPLVKAWRETRQGKVGGATALIAAPRSNQLSSIAAEQAAYMLLALGKVDEALPLARQAVADGGGRSVSLRLSYADALAKRGRDADALAMLDGPEATLVEARSRLAAGQKLGTAVDTPARGIAELLTILAVDLVRGEDSAFPVALTQVARHAAPESSEPTFLLAVIEREQEDYPSALAALARIAPADILASDALDLRVDILSEQKNHSAAIALAEAAAKAPGASIRAQRRLGGALADAGRHGEAALAYAQALARTPADSSNRWQLLVMRAASLEEANRWPEAKADLQAALALQPDQPIILNYLGYGELERGQEIEAAEAMIRKASALRPDDASIRDSLGWALYKRGRLAEAISTLQEAATGDPGQAEIHEHLGDALYASGRKIEARFSWNAALLTAGDDVKGRLQAKIESGLTPATAAP
jgi:tetratricopeptide (TPR) repeat protein